MLYEVITDQQARAVEHDQRRGDELSEIGNDFIDRLVQPVARTAEQAQIAEIIV